jgi:hypothetical protein
MKIILKKPFGSKEVKAAISLLVKNKTETNKMLKHFGGLKRGLDGLEYQHLNRNDWS